MLANPWQLLPSQQPFILEADRHEIELFNRQAKANIQVHLEALPEPFLGTSTAPIVLLSLNPGFGVDTLPFHQENSYFRETHRRNLLHAPLDFPFYLLDPRNEQSPGYQWWKARLRILIETCGQQRVANNIFCVEYFPYASEHFGFRDVLPSQNYGFQLVRQATERGAIILAMRGANYWFKALPELSTYPYFYRLNSVQSVYITPNNCPSGFPSIVRRIQAEK